MKKITFLFAVFLLFSGINMALVNSLNSYADSPGQISITAYDKNNHQLENTVFANNTLSLDYGNLEDDFRVTFRTNATNGIAQWKRNDVSLNLPEYQLTLYKNTTNELQLLLVGDCKYTFVLSNGQDEQSVDINVRITDLQEARKVLFVSSLTPQTISENTPEINFTALLPTTKSYSVTYYVKTPNSNDYALMTGASFNPENMVNGINGFGTYSFMAVAEESVSKTKTKIHYSNAINYSTSEITIDVDRITIVSEIVENTRARVEASRFSLTGASNLNYDLVQWYIGDSATPSAVGREFVYEPNTTDAYKVTAKYATTKEALTELDSVRIEPQATGTNLLILYVSAGVIGLSVIFAITIIITNKRRDIAW